MTHRLDVAYSRAISVRWLALAEKRLKHLTELFESGRWRRYYSEHSFLENIQEAKFAVNNWRALTLGEPITPRRTGFTLTVADGEALMEPADPRARKGEKTLDELILLAPAIDQVIAESDIVVPEAIDVAAFPPAQTIGRAARQETTDAEDDVGSPSLLDLDAIARRYPALRHAL